MNGVRSETQRRFRDRKFLEHDRGPHSSEKYDNCIRKNEGEYDLKKHFLDMHPKKIRVHLVQNMEIFNKFLDFSNSLILKYLFWFVFLILKKDSSRSFCEFCWFKRKLIQRLFNLLLILYKFRIFSSFSFSHFLNYLILLMFWSE